MVKDVDTDHVLARVTTRDKESGVSAAENLLNNTVCTYSSAVKSL